MKNTISFQGTIVTTGTAQNLPDIPVLMSVTISAGSANDEPIAVGNSSAVTAETGYLLAPGASVSIELAGGNTDQLWVVGTSGAIFSVVGA